MTPIRVADSESLPLERAAKLLGVSVWTLRKWAREGRIAHVRHGRGPRARIVFPDKDVQEYLRKHRQEAV